jgi:hypothetical protein
LKNLRRTSIAGIGCFAVLWIASIGDASENATSPDTTSSAITQNIPSRHTQQPRPPRIKIASVVPMTINKGTTAKIIVTASAPVTQATTVNYSLGGTGKLGMHYTVGGIPGQVTIPAGGSSANVTVQSLSTSLTTGSETVVVTLQAGTGYKVAKVKSHSQPPTLRIVDVIPTPIVITGISDFALTPLTPVQLKTTGLKPRLPVSVTFSGQNGFSVSKLPIRVGIDGTVVVNVPPYVDPRSRQIGAGSVSISVNQGANQSVPVPVTIQNLPPASANRSPSTNTTYDGCYDGTLSESIACNGTLTTEHDAAFKFSLANGAISGSGFSGRFKVSFTGTVNSGTWSASGPGIPGGSTEVGTWSTTSSGNPDGTYTGTFSPGAGTFQFTLTNGVLDGSGVSGPVTISFSGTVNNGTWSISGWPKFNGCTVGGTWSATLEDVPVITSPTTATATEGQLSVYQIVATNLPTSYGASGLPSGLNIDTNSGLIYGIPTVTGSFSISLSATNCVGTAGSETLTLTVQPPPAGPQIISSTSATGKVGEQFEFQVLTSNASRSASLTSSALPPGLVLNSSTNLISGTPTSAGSFLITLTLTDGMQTANATLQLTIVSDPFVPIITSPPNAVLVPGQPFLYLLFADERGPSFSYIGLDGMKHSGPTSAGLPPGLSFDGVATISGTYTPPSSGIGPYSTTRKQQKISARSVARSRIQPDTLKIRPPLGIIQIFGNNQNGTGTKPLNFFQPTTFASWEQEYFTPAQLNDPTVSCDSCDPANDGLPNLLKYAFNLDPTQPTTGGRPYAVSDPNYLSLVYTKSLAATDLTYTIQESTDLTNWSVVTPVNQILADDGFTQTIKAGVPLSDAGSAGKLFLRLRISH